MEDNVSNPVTIKKDVIVSNETFPFEGEAMPLKGNQDLKRLQQCLYTLESARIKIFKDIDKLYDVQDQSLADPLLFVSNLQQGIDIGIPNRLHIPDVPNIDWSKYKISVPLDDIRPVTRPKQLKCETDSEITVEKKKSSSFKQLWSAEEQLRLEELLVKFPPQDNESRRFAKIAAALGNRTVAQVTSRCQKYFMKLQKARLPIPGRPPRRSQLNPIRYSKSRTYMKSNLFPRAEPLVRFREDGDLPGTSSIEMTRVKEEPMDSEDSLDLSDSARNTDEFRKLMLFKRIKKDKLIVAAKNGDASDITHPGFRCNLCHEDPLRGTRWHCEDCGHGDDTFDLCTTCLISQLEGDSPHPLSHHLVPYRSALLAGDYSYNTGPSGYNYLDPNFLPD